MSHLLEFDKDEKVIRVTVRGDLNAEGVAAIYRTVRQFLAGRDVRGGILDLSHVTSLEVPSEMVRLFSKEPPLFKPSQPRVIVAANDLVYGMARLFQISRSEIHTELHVVRTLQEAYEIAGLQLPNFVAVNDVSSSSDPKESKQGTA
jgi:hypothetical protein